MSLDIYLRGDGGDGDRVWEGNVTYNLGPMWRAAGLPYSESIEGKPAGELVHWLETGLADLRANPETYRAMDPPNKWGSYEGLIDFTERLLTAAREHPEAVVETSR